MTTFGTNMKLTAPRSCRTALHGVMTEALGCESMSPEDDLVLYRLADGFNLGVYFVADDEALGEADQPKAPWLELVVEDLSARAAALARLEVEVVPYPRDPEHTYYRMPGGPVFRLAPSD